MRLVLQFVKLLGLLAPACILISEIVRDKISGSASRDCGIEDLSGAALSLPESHLLDDPQTGPSPMLPGADEESRGVS